MGNHAFRVFETFYIILCTKYFKEGVEKKEDVIFFNHRAFQSK